MRKSSSKNSNLNPSSLNCNSTMSHHIMLFAPTLVSTLARHARSFLSMPVLLSALLLCLLLAQAPIARGQPYLYRADDVRGTQLFSDLSFLLGMEVRDEGSGVAQRKIIGEFRGETRKAFLDTLALAARFAWATHKNTLILSSRTSLQTRTYRFASKEEANNFGRAYNASASPQVPDRNIPEDNASDNSSAR